MAERLLRLLQGVAGEAARPPWLAALALSALGLLATGLGSSGVAFASLCGTIIAPGASLSLLFAINPLPALLLGWAAMLAAMLPLLIAVPVRDLRLGALKRSRNAMSLAFVVGYLLPWLAIFPVAMVVVGLVAGTPMPLLTALVLAAAWQLSSWRRGCLARGHRRSRLRAFGLPALADAIRAGCGKGLWCVATCLPLMLVPFLAPGWHLPLMMLASLFLAIERLLPVPRGQRRAVRLTSPSTWRSSASPVSTGTGGRLPAKGAPRTA